MQAKSHGWLHFPQVCLLLFLHLIHCPQLQLAQHLENSSISFTFTSSNYVSNSSNQAEKVVGHYVWPSDFDLLALIVGWTSDHMTLKLTKFPEGSVINRDTSMDIIFNVVS